jgi:hypothetical protein
MYAKRWLLKSGALMMLMLLVGCASPMVSVHPPESPAAQQQDREDCAAIAARSTQDYAWNPLADLAAIRATREAVCLESRGYRTPPQLSWLPLGASLQEQPDPMRRCFQHAYTWLGLYNGPIDGRPNTLWQAAQAAYLTERQIMSDHPDTLEQERTSLQRDLQALGKAAEWQACLMEATEAQP